jgi:ribosomal protein L5
MIYTQKSIDLYNFYTKRDLLFKLNSSNVYENYVIDNLSLQFDSLNGEKLYSSMSALSLISDSYPYIIRIKNSGDKKKVGNIVGCKVRLNGLLKDFFLLRLQQNLLSFVTDFDLIKKEFLRNKEKPTNTFVIHLKTTSFDEISFFYEKYMDLPNLRVIFNFKNFNNAKVNLLLSSWIDKLCIA